MADFDPAFNVSPAGLHAQHPQVAVDPDGDAVMVWQNASTGIVQARRRSADGTLGAVRTISAPGQQGDNPQVGVATNGNAVVVWLRSDEANLRVQARSFPATGALGDIQTLSAVADNAFDARVAVAPDGRAIIVWRLQDRVQARFRSASGGLGGIKRLSATGRPVVQPVVDIADNGHALIAWIRNREGLPDLLEARSRSASGTLGQIHTMSELNHQAANPDVAVDADGDGLVVWDNISPAPAGDRHIKSRALSATGTLGAVEILSEEGGMRNPQAAVQNNGDAIVTWVHDQTIEARTRSAAGLLGDIQALTAGGSEDLPQVAYAEGGRAVFVWERDNASFVTRIQGRSRLASGALTAIENLSAAGRSGIEPQVALGGGKAIAVWERVDNNNFARVQAAEGP